MLSPKKTRSSVNSVDLSPIQQQNTPFRYTWDFFQGHIWSYETVFRNCKRSKSHRV